VSRQPAFVNVHAAVGTAQIAGQMYNAHFDGSGLVVTAGMSDNTVASDDMVIAPRPGFSQSEINRQFTKIAWDVRSGASSALAIRRAYKLAGTAPGGPVYVAFSTRALAESVKAEVFPREAFLVDARPRAAVDQVEAAARALVEAKRPVVLLGDEVFKADAAVDAVALCEMLGLPIVTPNLAGFNYLSATNPLYLGTRFGGDRGYPYSNADLIVQIGSRESGGAETPAGTDAPRYVAVGLDTNMLGRTRALDLAVVGDVKVTVKDLADAVGAMVTRDRLSRLRDERLAVITPATAAATAARLAQARKVFNQSVIHPDQVGYEMEQGLEKNALLVTENAPGLQGKHDFLSYGPRADQKQNIGHGGGSLGWGVGAAVGAKLAARIGRSSSAGDGSVMYARAALGRWRATPRAGAPSSGTIATTRRSATAPIAATAHGRDREISGALPRRSRYRLREARGEPGREGPARERCRRGAAIRTGTAETRAQPYCSSSSCRGSGAAPTRRGPRR
jgi:thiamine pyrophosphate-dependent acetolactate synthase large subunit-like protein